MFADLSVVLNLQAPWTEARELFKHVRFYSFIYLFIDKYRYPEGLVWSPIPNSWQVAHTIKHQDTFETNTKENCMQYQITCFELCFSTLITTTSACPGMFLQLVARQASVLMNSHEKVRGRQQKLYSPIPGQPSAAQWWHSPCYKPKNGKYDFGTMLLRQEKPHSAALSTVGSCNTNHLQIIWRSSYCVGMKHSFSSLDNPQGATRHAHLSTRCKFHRRWVKVRYPVLWFHLNDRVKYLEVSLKCVATTARRRKKYRKQEGRRWLSCCVISNTASGSSAMLG